MQGRAVDAVSGKPGKTITIYSMKNTLECYTFLNRTGGHNRPPAIIQAAKRYQIMNNTVCNTDYDRQDLCKTCPSAFIIYTLVKKFQEYKDKEEK